MAKFPDLGDYKPKDQDQDFFDDGREIELLHFVYEHPDLEGMRGSPKRVLDAIDGFARSKKYLMNVGREKGRIVCDLIADVKPKTMVELGGYIGYSAIMFGNAVREAGTGDEVYYSVEKNPEFAAVATALLSLAGLSDFVQVVIGSSSTSIVRLCTDHGLDRIDLLFLDHYKPFYAADLKLCEDLDLIVPNTVIAADNVIHPGNPPYLKYVRSSVDEKRKSLKLEEVAMSIEMPKETVDQYKKRYGVMNTGKYVGNPNLVYDSKLIEGAEPTGEPDGVEVTKCPATPQFAFNRLHSPHLAAIMIPQDALLLLLSFIWLPISTLITITSFLITSFKKFKPHPNTPPKNPKTILITGISMTKGLTIARLLAKHKPRSYRVIAADTESIPFTSPGRYSRAISKFYRLDEENSIYYITSLLRVIRDEKVNLWISCSGVTHEVDDGRAAELAKEEVQKQGKRQFRAIQLNADIVQTLHAKDTFIDYIRRLGMTVPESYLCISAGEVEVILSTYQNQNQPDADPEKTTESWKGEGNGKKFLLKPLDVNDAARSTFTCTSSPSLLPLSTPSETRAYLSNQSLALSISPESPVLLQERINGTEYCTHALVIRGEVKAFVACRSSSMLMFYEPLDADDLLSVRMRGFTEGVVRDLARKGSSSPAGGESGGKGEWEGVNGHLSFDFIVQDPFPHDRGLGEDDGKGEGNIKLYPIECNPRAHTAVVLFSESAEMAGAYLSALDGDDSTSGAEAEAEEGFELPVVVPSPNFPPKSYYWIGHDLVTLLILPVYELIITLSHGILTQTTELIKFLPEILLTETEDRDGERPSFRQYLSPSAQTQACMQETRTKLRTFWDHIRYSTDGTYDPWDPVPFFVLYHVYWPARFVDCIVRGKRWSAVNVSTGKMFEC
ncbi:uncharacterized protein BDV17DRAFT_296561 [Aspergillus undulatus]|uniref:uncharacterized protein n=1 Tax=Aspergillus undulatus TaxID=1810928 RepID=UPI003CCE0A95